MKNDSQKKLGLIRYVLLVISHPEWQPSNAQMAGFLYEKLPEFEKQPSGTAKVGFMFDTKPMNLIDMTALAIETFGNEIADESKYIGRTLHYGIDGGESKILVVYDIVPEKTKKWYQIW